MRQCLHMKNNISIKTIWLKNKIDTVVVSVASDKVKNKRVQSQIELEVSGAANHISKKKKKKHKISLRHKYLIEDIVGV